MSIKFADVAEERRGSIMRCERNVITMTLLRIDYLVHNLDNYVITLTTETGLRVHRAQLKIGLAVSTTDVLTNPPAKKKLLSLSKKADTLKIPFFYTCTHTTR